MYQGLVQALEGLLSDQVALAKSVNVLADKQFDALRGQSEGFSADDAAEMARMTAAIEVYEVEKVAMLAKAGLSLADVRSLSPGLSNYLEQLRAELTSMREGIGRNAKLLDAQITRTKSMIVAVRIALGGAMEGSGEYDPRGRIRGHASGGLLGAG